MYETYEVDNMALEIASSDAAGGKNEERKYEPDELEENLVAILEVK